MIAVNSVHKAPLPLNAACVRAVPQPEAASLMLVPELSQRTNGKEGAPVYSCV